MKKFFNLIVLVQTLSVLIGSFSSAKSSLTAPLELPSLSSDYDVIEQLFEGANDDISLDNIQDISTIIESSPNNWKCWVVGSRSNKAKAEYMGLLAKVNVKIKDKVPAGPEIPSRGPLLPTIPGSQEIPAVYEYRLALSSALEPVINDKLLVQLDAIDVKQSSSISFSGKQIEQRTNRSTWDYFGGGGFMNEKAIVRVRKNIDFLVLKMGRAYFRDTETDPFWAGRYAYCYK